MPLKSTGTTSSRHAPHGWLASGKTRPRPDGCPSRNTLARSARLPVPSNQSAFHPVAHNRQPSPRSGFVGRSASANPRLTPPIGPVFDGAGALMPRRKICSCRYSGRWSQYLLTIMCASNPGAGDCDPASVQAAAPLPERVRLRCGAHISGGPAGGAESGPVHNRVAR